MTPIYRDHLYFKGQPYKIFDGLPRLNPNTAFHEPFPPFVMDGGAAGHTCIYLVDDYLWLERIVVKLRDFDQAKALEGKSPLLFGVKPKQLGSHTSRRWVYPVHKLMDTVPVVRVGLTQINDSSLFPYPEKTLELVLRFSKGRLVSVKKTNLKQNKKPIYQVKEFVGKILGKARNPF
jgi:hypothetical protein